MDAAGYKGRRNCTRLLKMPAIAERIAELSGTAAERTVITLEHLMEKAEDVRRLAMASGQCSAAVAAIRELGTCPTCRSRNAACATAALRR